MDYKDDNFGEVIYPNYNKRFSGVTATTLYTGRLVQKEHSVVTFGYPLADDIPHLSFWQMVKLLRKPLPDGRYRIFHARRNVEMARGIVLRKLFGAKIHLLFTSTAQRHHTWSTRFFYHRMDKLLATSERTASYLRIPADVIVPHGVDITKYVPTDNVAEAWAKLGLPGERGVGIFGRVRPSKGIYEFVHALCKVLPDFPGYTGVICGETTPPFAKFVDELKAHIAAKNLSDRFVWLDRMPIEKAPEFFQAMTVAAAVARLEGFGLTCLEGMACGTPFVGTRTGAYEMIIREGVDGMLVPCESVDPLADVFRTMLSKSPEELEEMGRAARQRIVDEFTIEKEASSLVNFYRSCWEESAR